MAQFSSHEALLISIGICAYIAVLHLALARRGERAHPWVAVWCAASLLFQGARYVQLDTPDTATAVAAARLYAAMGPVLVWALVGFSVALRRASNRSPGMLAYGAATLAFSLALGCTSWFVPGVTETRYGWFGDPYIGVPGSLGVLAIGPVIAGGLAYAVHSLLRTRELTVGDRVLLIGTLVAYASMGIVSMLSAVHMLEVPGLAEFGPLVVGVGLNQLLVRRHVRLRDRLEDAVAERTSDLESTARRLGEEQAHYRALFDHVPAPVSVWGVDGRLLDMNRAGRKMLQVDEDLPDVNAFDIEPARVSGAADLIGRAAETGHAVHAEVRLDVQVGAFDLVVSAVPMGEPGAVDAVLLISEDVGERRELEETLRQMQKLDALGRLAAGIAHEINNPLAFVRSNLAQLQRGTEQIVADLRKQGHTVPEALSECEEVIEDSAAGVERVIALVRDIKGYAHSAPGEVGAHDLGPLVGDSVRVACVDRAPSVAIEVRCDDSLPSIPCQPNRLRQVFVNLVANALDAVGDAGRVEVSTRRDGTHAVVRVVDDGCGMDAETRQKVLEPFFTTKPAGQGTGLGLYVAHEIVRWHRGEIRIETEPGRGSAVEVRLPLERA